MGAIGGCEFQGAETDNLMQVQWILVDISIYNGVCVC